MNLFDELSAKTVNDTLDTATLLDQLRFNAQGLIPAIAQQADTGEVLMMAWMNRAAIQESLETGQVCYWSRSRQAFWRKGERSGHTQTLIAMRTDCDGDCLLLQVDQKGPACHTNRRNCFYIDIEQSQSRIAADPVK